MSPLLEDNHYLGEEQDEEIPRVKLMFQNIQRTMDGNIMSLMDIMRSYVMPIPLALCPTFESLKTES